MSWGKEEREVLDLDRKLHMEEEWLDPWREREGGLLEPPWSRRSNRMEWRERVTTTAMKKKGCVVEVAM
jgi:hypothetical protein